MSKENSNNNSRTNKVLIICVMVLIIAILAVGIFFILDRNKKNISLEKEKKSKVEFLDFKIISINSKDNIIGKTKNNEWIQIVETDEYTSVLGVYQNRLYYHDDNGLKYVDLNKEEFESTTWINYQNNGIDDIDKIFDAAMINDTVYFSKYPSSELLKLSINETNFNNATEVLQDVSSNDWKIDTENEIVYYIDYYNNGLYKYNLKTNKNEKLFDGEIQELELCNNYVVYSTDAEQEELYIYDLKSKRNILVSDTYVWGNAFNKLQIYNNDFYYIDNGKLIKYDSGSKDVIYTHDNLVSFFILDDNLIELELYYADEEKTEELYLIDGKISKESPERVIHMKNGEIKKITL